MNGRKPAKAAAEGIPKLEQKELHRQNPPEPERNDTVSRLPSLYIQSAFP